MLGVKSCFLLPFTDGWTMTRPLRLLFPGAIPHLTA